MFLTEKSLGSSKPEKSQGIASTAKKNHKQPVLIVDQKLVDAALQLAKDTKHHQKMPIKNANAMGVKNPNATGVKISPTKHATHLKSSSSTPLNINSSPILGDISSKSSVTISPAQPFDVTSLPAAQKMGKFLPSSTSTANTSPIIPSSNRSNGNKYSSNVNSPSVSPLSSSNISSLNAAANNYYDVYQAHVSSSNSVNRSSNVNSSPASKHQSGARPPSNQSAAVLNAQSASRSSSNSQSSPSSNKHSSFSIASLATSAVKHSGMICDMGIRPFDM